MKILIKNAKIIKSFSSTPFSGDILIENDKIINISDKITIDKSDKTIDATNYIAIPGFIQTHIHLAQTIFRNLAEDVPLLDWLYKYILPLESKHNENTLYDSARLGIAELLLSGTTTIQDMETIHFTHTSFKAAEEMGIRTCMGNMLMDKGNEILSESIDFLIKESESLYRKWNNYDNGRIKYVLTPRFALSCSKDLFNEIKIMSEKSNIPIHTHAAENLKETEIVKKETGYRNIEYFERIGIASPKLRLAHCIWLNDYEYDILMKNDIKVLHCPSTNLKLGSGIAKVPEMLDTGINVSIGADGPPCNNNLNIFNEMKLAGLIQKLRIGADSMPAENIFKMATINGAKALGLEKDIGTLEEGKKADIVLLKSNIHSFDYEEKNILSTIIYSMNRDNVAYTIVNGKILVEEGKLLVAKEKEILENAKESRLHFIRNL
jgi:cytosine/adenosine deaminase-related metal-dependent hydrolase